MNPQNQQPAQVPGSQPQASTQQPENQPTSQGQPSQPLSGQSNKPNSTQNTLIIAEIRDGIIIMNDGSYRAVILAQSINFDLMSPEERDAVEFSYQGFLNSLYFPIQILIRSQKVDIQPYLEKLGKMRNEQDNMLLAYLMEDYISYIRYLAKETNIMDKQFYIVIPYFPTINAKAAVSTSKKLFGNALRGNKKRQIIIDENDLETAKTELKNRIQSVLNGLSQVGVQGIPLDTQELIELYYDVYNPDTATHHKMIGRNDLNVPVVSKGQGDASAPHLDSEGVN